MKLTIHNVKQDGRNIIYSPPIKVEKDHEVYTISMDDSVAVYHYHNVDYYCKKHGEKYRKMYEKAIQFVFDNLLGVIDPNSWDMDDYIGVLITRVR